MLNIYVESIMRTCHLSTVCVSIGLVASCNHSVECTNLDILISATLDHVLQ